MRQLDLDEEFELDGVSIGVSIPDQLFEQVASYLGKAVVVEEREPEREGKEVLPSAIKQGDWLCLRCEVPYLERTVLCDRCGKFRDIASFPNILFSPDTVSAMELEYLAKRRELEKRLVLDLEMRSATAEHEQWYFVATSWLLQWKMFLLNEQLPGAKVGARESPNPAVGVLPPGPIHNLPLLLKSPHGLSVRPGLAGQQDYSVLSEGVWT